MNDGENRREIRNCLLLLSYQMPQGDCHKQKSLFVPGFPFWFFLFSGQLETLWTGVLPLTALDWWDCHSLLVLSPGFVALANLSTSAVHEWSSFWVASEPSAQSHCFSRHKVAFPTWYSQNPQAWLLKSSFFTSPFILWGGIYPDSRE